MSLKWVSEGWARQEHKAWQPGGPVILIPYQHNDQKDAADRANRIIELQILWIMKLR